MAMGKPVITGDSPAAREFLADGQDSLLCRRGSAEDLARAILVLKHDRDLGRRLGDTARRRFLEEASPRVVGRILTEKLQSWRSTGERGA
jgi:glycosyltransferase involved in cell wall biosynthesis